LLRELQKTWPEGTGLDFIVARGRNRGGDVDVIHSVA
jgi:hypothetical protein